MGNAEKVLEGEKDIQKSKKGVVRESGVISNIVLL